MLGEPAHPVAIGEHMNQTQTQHLAVLGGLLLGLCLSFPVSLGAATQAKAAFFDQAAEVITPANLQAGQVYPLLVVLPATDFPARDIYENYARDLGDNWIVLLPPGCPSSEDYLPDFMSFVSWYDTMLQGQIQEVCSRWPVDRQAMVVTGHSLGGDLGWALAARNPGQFCGMVISGTRCSYPFKAAALATLKQQGFKASLFIGDLDTETRTKGLKAAFNLLQKNSVASRFVVLPDHDHRHIPPARLLESLEWILGRNLAAAGGQALPDVPVPAVPVPGSGESGSQGRPASGKQSSLDSLIAAGTAASRNLAASPTPVPAKARPVLTPAPVKTAQPKASPASTPARQVAASAGVLALTELQQAINAAASGETVKVSVPTGKAVVVPGLALRHLVQPANQTKRLQIQPLNAQGQFACIWMFEGKAGLAGNLQPLPDVDYSLSLESTMAQAFERAFGRLESPLYLNFATGPTGRDAPALAMKSWLFLRPGEDFRQHQDTARLKLYRYDPARDVVMQVAANLTLDQNGILAMPFTQGGWYFVCDRQML